VGIDCPRQIRSGRAQKKHRITRRRCRRRCSIQLGQADHVVERVDLGGTLRFDAAAGLTASTDQASGRIGAEPIRRIPTDAAWDQGTSRRRYTRKGTRRFPERRKGQCTRCPHIGSNRPEARQGPCPTGPSNALVDCFRIVRDPGFEHTAKGWQQQVRFERRAIQSIRYTSASLNEC
jgi:hypothetical protein